jgi:GTP-binding protein HflX
MIEKKKTIIQQIQPENCILIAVQTASQSENDIHEYLDELAFLAETAGAITVKRLVQKLPHPENTSYLGTGKLIELKQLVETYNIDIVIADDELSGKQINTLEKELKCKILDRSSLILDIFANRARTAQAKAQVELAQFQYLYPRLRGMWSHLERQRGGIGMRGPGEKEIETDRRIVKDKIALLKEKLIEIDKQSFTQRKTRGELIRVGLVGYTNVGKSTIMNYVSKSDVLAENKLFATLDTTTRKVVLEQTPFLISDTVGFIRKLPHHLVESFKSTLDEVRESDILLHVVDISHIQFEHHIQVVNDTLRDIKADDKAVIYVFNKTDLYKKLFVDEQLKDEIRNEIIHDFEQTWMNKLGENCIFISAKTGENMDLLREKLIIKVQEYYKIRYPYKTNFW